MGVTAESRKALEDLNNQDGRLLKVDVNAFIAANPLLGVSSVPKAGQPTMEAKMKELCEVYGIAYIDRASGWKQ